MTASTICVAGSTPRAGILRHRHQVHQWRGRQPGRRRFQRRRLPRRSGKACGAGGHLVTGRAAWRQPRARAGDDRTLRQFGDQAPSKNSSPCLTSLSHHFPAHSLGLTPAKSARGPPSSSSRPPSPPPPQSPLPIHRREGLLAPLPPLLPAPAPSPSRTHSEPLSAVSGHPAAGVLRPCCPAPPLSTPITLCHAQRVVPAPSPPIPRQSPDCP